MVHHGFRRGRLVRSSLYIGGGRATRVDKSRDMWLLNFARRRTCAYFSHALFSSTLRNLISQPYHVSQPELGVVGVRLSTVLFLHARWPHPQGSSLRRSQGPAPTISPEIRNFLPTTCCVLESLDLLELIGLSSWNVRRKCRKVLSFASLLPRGSDLTNQSRQKSPSLTFEAVWLAAYATFALVAGARYVYSYTSDPGTCSQRVRCKEQASPIYRASFISRNIQFNLFQAADDFDSLLTSMLWSKVNYSISRILCSSSRSGIASSIES